MYKIPPFMGMIVLLWHLSLLYLGLCSGQLDTGLDKSKRPHTGHHHHRKKGQFHTPDVKLKYGTDLPSFSFDYSEYFMGAMIERSFDKNELHLTMFLLGHKSIGSLSTFESLSTEDEILYSWGQATKVWSAFHASSSNSSTTVGSGLFCTIHNNDNRHSPYQVPAYWVSSSGSMNGVHAILRCKIKGALAIYKNETFSSGKKLFVDVSRKHCSKHHPEACLHPLSSAHNSSAAAAGIGVGSNSGSSSTVMSSDPTSVIISFTVPWRSRYVGYPLQFQLNSTHFDSWGSVTASSPVGPSTDSTLDSLSAAPNKGVTHVCVSGLRPLNPLRAEVGLPMLIEFVQHHLGMGVTHILLGMMIDWHSPVMYKHLHALRHFISEGRVSLVSLNAEKKAFEGSPSGTAGIDDVAGVEGVQLQDDFADSLFLNQCLYFSKGLADSVILLRASDFLVPAALYGDRTDLSDLIQRATTISLLSSHNTEPSKREFTAVKSTRRLLDVESTARAVNANAGHLRRTGRLHGHAAGGLNDTSTAGSTGLRSGRGRQHSTNSSSGGNSGTASGSSAASAQSQPHLRIGHRLYRPPSAASNVTWQGSSSSIVGAGEPSGVCYLMVPLYGVADPNSVFASWGPGDDYWTKDYFKLTAKTVLPLHPSTTPGVLILPTRNVISVEVAAGRHITAHCKHRQHSHNSTGGGIGAHRVHHSQPLLQSAVVPVDVFVAVLHRETFVSSQINVSPGRQTALAGLYAHNLQSLHNLTAVHLKSVGLSSIKAVKSLVKESRSDFTSSINGRYTFKSRESVKKPFWRSCSSRPLSEVVAQGYSS